MSDYLEQIAAAKTDIARLKGEKEAFEQSNEPDDADEEELENWNYAKDLERQIRELKAENRDALKELAKLEKAAAKTLKDNRLHSREGARGSGYAASQSSAHSLSSTKSPHSKPHSRLTSKSKRDLTAARARFRKLTDEFVSELKNRCGFMGDDKKRALVLELFARTCRPVSTRCKREAAGAGAVRRGAMGQVRGSSWRYH